MYVFNGAAFVQLLVALVPGLIVYFVAWLLGAGPTTSASIGMAMGLASMVCFDLVWRLIGLSEGEEDEERTSVPLRMVVPSGGGHLFFVPTWAAGGLMAVMVATGTMALT